MTSADAQFSWAIEHRRCLATKLAVTQQPCRHGYTWQCPNAMDLVRLLIEARDAVLQRGGKEDQFVRLVEEAIPWLADRRKGPADRRHAQRR